MLLLAGLAIWVLPTRAYAQAGSLDTGFAASTDFLGSVDSIAVQPDGKIILGGQFATINGMTRGGIARLNADGSLDTSFNPGTGVESSYVDSVAVQADGKIVIGGFFPTVNGVPHSGIARLNADGSLDTGFAASADKYGEVRSIAVQPDGKIVLGGHFTTINGVARNSVARLNADGSLDAGFNPGSGVGGSYGNDGIYSVAVQADGKIVLGGRFTAVNGLARNNVARLNGDGSVDTGFNTITGADNVVRTGTGADRDVLSVAVQADGKIVLGGNYTVFNGVARGGIARLNADGSLDTGFNPGTGTAYPEAGGSYPTVFSVALQPDGKIVIGGFFSLFNGVARGDIARLNADGSLDTGFNPGSGVSGTSSDVLFVAVQGDGKIVLGGRFAAVNGVARRSVARLNGATAHPPFFSGEVPLSNGVYYLAFPGNGNIFGYYSYLSDPRFIYHFDLGYEYWFDNSVNDGSGGIFFYDFKSGSFFYTSPSFPFPYLYDFSLNAVLYYFPDPNNPGRYNTNGVRYFYNYATGQIITK